MDCKVAKKPRVNVNNHEAIMRTLNNSGVHGGATRRKPLLFKRNIAVHLPK